VCWVTWDTSHQLSVRKGDGACVSIDRGTGLAEHSLIEIGVPLASGCQLTHSAFALFSVLVNREYLSVGVKPHVLEQESDPLVTIQSPGDLSTRTPTPFNMGGKCIVGASCVAQGPEKHFTVRFGVVVAGVVKTPGCAGFGLAPLGAVYYSGGQLHAKRKKVSPRPSVERVSWYKEEQPPRTRKSSWSSST